MDDEHFLSRAFIEAGGIETLVAQDAPELKLLTAAERMATLRATLDARPPGDAWLFGYGSLIWNPTIRSVERRTARIEGWHRAFCLITHAGRGSREHPGLVLGLEEGGSCTGMALRIADDVLEYELSLLWRREMLTGAYVPRWVDLLDEQGVRFGSAVTFTVNVLGEHYVGHLARAKVIESLATATGTLGSAADYLFRTCDGLRMYGIPDADLDQLAAEVGAAQVQEGLKT
jgi:cation transport protein ChaC